MKDFNNCEVEMKHSKRSQPCINGLGIAEDSRKFVGGSVDILCSAGV